MDDHRITSITSEGLSYRDENGNLIVINFKECAENYRNVVLTSTEFDITDPETLRRETPKCVGWCNVTAKPPFIEFFAQPRVKFEFPRTWRSWNAEKKFLELQHKITELGWTTFDLS